MGDLNTDCLNGRIALPLPPGDPKARAEMEIYARFMRHLRSVPRSTSDIKVLSAIQFTADMLDYGDALVAKILVDLGLRAPRRAFPASFLDYVDRSGLRSGAEYGGPAPSTLGLRQHWARIGEDRLAPFRKEYALLDERLVVISC